MTYKGCNHISTDLGSHKAQTLCVTVQLDILLQLYVYIIMQLHIIHQRPRIMIVYHMISEVIQNNLNCIIRFHGVDVPKVFQWGCQ